MVPCRSRVYHRHRGKEMKRLAAFILALLILCGAALSEQAKREVLYFYSNYCEQCDPAGEFAEQFEQLTGLSAEECAYSRAKKRKDRA